MTLLNFRNMRKFPFITQVHCYWCCKPKPHYGRRLDAWDRRMLVRFPVEVMLDLDCKDWIIARRVQGQSRRREHMARSMRPTRNGNNARMIRVQKVNICQEVWRCQILLCLHKNKKTFHYFMDAGRRHKTPGSEIKGIVTHMALPMFIHYRPLPKSCRIDVEGPGRAAAQWVCHYWWILSSGVWSSEMRSQSAGQTNLLSLPEELKISNS